MSYLHVEETKPIQGKSQIFAGPGSPTSWLAYHTAGRLFTHGLHPEWLGGIAGNWNTEDDDVMRHVPHETPILTPKQTLPGLPHGFRGDPAACERTRHLWLPFYERAFEKLRRISDTNGLVGGQVTYQLTPGGHLPQIYDIVRLGREHFPEALHIGLLWLPTRNRGLWKNLRRYPHWPDDLDLPIIIADNEHAPRIDSAVPTLISTVIAAKWMGDRRQQSIMEMLEQMITRHRLLGLSERHVDLPVVDVPVWERARRWVIGKAPGVASQAIPLRVANLIVDLLQDQARLIDGPAYDGREFTFAGVGGLPMPTTNDPRVRKEARQQFQETVVKLVETRLQQLGQTLPSGLQVVWASVVDGLPNNFVRIPAVHVYPIPGLTARSYIDAMLAEDTLLGLRALPPAHQDPPGDQERSA